MSEVLPLLESIATELSRQWGLLGLRMTQLRKEKIATEKYRADSRVAIDEINLLTKQFHDQLREQREGM